MNLQSLILTVLKISIMLMVFGIGLRASREDVSYLFRRPAKLLRSFLSMDIILPALAVALALMFDLRPPVKIALVTLAISPVPPLLPKRQAKAGAKGGYAVGLLFAMAAIAILYIPSAIAVIDMIFPVSVYMPFLAVLKVALFTVLLPLVAGVLASSAAPRFGGRIAKPVTLVAALLLFLGLLPVLVRSMPAVVSLIGDGSVATFAVFVVVGLVVGHAMGGPIPEDRPVLALATASRHPAIAATIAIANFPEQKLVFPAILLYFLVNIVLCLPYMIWLKRRTESHVAMSASS